MTVHTEQGIRIDNWYIAAVVLPNHTRQIFQIHLVANPHAWRNDPEILECLLTPFDELIPFAVSGEFDLHVPIDGIGRTGNVHHHRMINDHIDGGHGIDIVGITTEIHHGIAHSRHVGYELNTGGVGHHQAGRSKCDFELDGFLSGLCQGSDVLFRNCPAILVTQKIFEQDFQCPRQIRNGSNSSLLSGLKAEIAMFTPTHFERPDHVETVTAVGSHARITSPYRRRPNLNHSRISRKRWN